MLFIFAFFAHLNAQVFNYNAAPKVLPKDFIERFHLIKYPELDFHVAKAIRRIQGKRHYVRAPLGRGRIFINEKSYKQNNWEVLDQFFLQKSYATIPKDKRILTYNLSEKDDPEEREVWEYPIGTLLAHEIRLNSENELWYELRLVWKGLDQQWHFATYLPFEDPLSEESSGFKLQTKEDLEDRIFHVNIKNFAREQLIKTKAIESRKCAACHRTESLSFYQYPKLRDTGPCGFVSKNPLIKSHWAISWRKHFNIQEGPFEEK